MWMPVMSDKNNEVNKFVKETVTSENSPSYGDLQVRSAEAIKKIMKKQNEIAVADGIKRDLKEKFVPLMSDQGNEVASFVKEAITSENSPTEVDLMDRRAATFAKRQSDWRKSNGLEK